MAVGSLKEADTDKKPSKAARRRVSQSTPREQIATCDSISSGAQANKTNEEEERRAELLEATKGLVRPAVQCEHSLGSRWLARCTADVELPPKRRAHFGCVDAYACKVDERAVEKAALEKLMGPSHAIAEAMPIACAAAPGCTTHRPCRGCSQAHCCASDHILSRVTSALRV